MPNLKLARIVPMQEMWALLGAMAPFGWRVMPTNNGFVVERENAKVRLKVKQHAKGTRIQTSLEYPWWTWLGLLGGLVGAVVTSAVYYGIAKPLLQDVQSRLALLATPGLAQALPPGSPRPCPYCLAIVQPAQDPAGQMVCPLCRNTGHPLGRSRSRGMNPGLIVGIVLGGVALIVILAAVVFVLVSNASGPHVFSEATETIPPFTSMTIDLPMTQRDRRDVSYSFTVTNGNAVSAGFYRVERNTGAADWATGVAVTPESLTGTRSSTLGGPDWGFVVSCDSAEPCVVQYRVEWTRADGN